jgi:hypothetical protein
MSDHVTPESGQTAVLGDLTSLAASGVTVDRLAKCQALAEMIFGPDLPTFSSLPPDRREPLTRRMKDVLSDVAAIAQRRAFEGYHGIAQELNDPTCQAAAATELLELEVSSADFDVVRRKRYKDDKWKQITKTKQFSKPGSARRRQLNAGVWIRRGYRTARENAGDLLVAFEQVLKGYLDIEARRRELRAFVIRQLELQQPGVVATSLVDGGVDPLPLSTKEPDDLISYVSRPAYEAEFDAIVSSGAKLIALEGEPGNGKSRLAKAVIARRMRRMRAGDTWIRLTADASLMSHIAGVLQSRASQKVNKYPTDDDPLVRAFAAFLSSADAPTYVLSLFHPVPAS